ncbi:hypothetical protein RISK_005312 [Rhodopirellula islandica]|uniref:Uncharacterized protein n=1 Tax=Rhodopirellula islandica TaxID=595434 RepID=A0A0J1B6Y7_RHOIS|nr:hypothetical protein RISK_005312 [Rhodopirellula islandica]
MFLQFSSPIPTSKEAWKHSAGGVYRWPIHRFAKVTREGTSLWSVHLEWRA